MRERDRLLGIYERMAPGYDRQVDWFDRFFVEDGRTWACSQARGEVLEIGVGTGRNLAFYPRDVRLVAIDLSPAMLALARRRADTIGRAVELRAGDAEELAFGDASFDTVVMTLVLCTVPDPRRVAMEVRRVLRRGGRCLCVDHVRSPNALVRAGQTLLDPLLVRVAGDHLVREPADFLAAADLSVVSLERSKWGIMERLVAERG